MKNTMKIKVPVTTVTLAILYTDDSSKITTKDLTGKYSVASAKKYFKENPICNAKTVSVMDVKKNTICYEIELEKLMKTLVENGQIITDENQTEESTEE